MLKKALYKHTKDFLEKNLPENFFLFKKSNKKRKKYFNFKAAFVKTNLYKLKKNYRHLPLQDPAPLHRRRSLNQPPIPHSNISKLSTKYFLNDNFLFSLSTIKNVFEKRQTRSSDFKNKLKEKKKLSLLYGNLSDKSIKKALLYAIKLSGNINENLLLVLETRLEIVLYRALFFSSISSAKQYIKKKKLKVNSSFINTPSYSIKSGDIISVCKKNRKQVLNNMIKYFIKYNIITQSSNKDLYYNNDIYLAGKGSEAVGNLSEAALQGSEAAAQQPETVGNLSEAALQGSEAVGNNFLAFKQPGVFADFKESLYGLKKNNLRPLSGKLIEKGVLQTKKQISQKLFNYDLVHNVYKNLLLLKINFKQNLHSYKNLCLTDNDQANKSFLQTFKKTLRLYWGKKNLAACTDSELNLNLCKHCFKPSFLKTIKVPFFYKKLAAKQSGKLSLGKKIQLVKKTQPYNNFLQNTSLVDVCVNSELENSLQTIRKSLHTKSLQSHIYKPYPGKKYNTDSETSINGVKKLNMYTSVLGFFRKHYMCNISLIQYINNMYLSNHANGFVLKKILYLKKAFKQKHRYIIPNFYITFLKNQIKLSNVFLLKKYIDIHAKNFLLQKIFTKVKKIKKNISTSVSHFSSVLVYKLKILVLVILNKKFPSSADVNKTVYQKKQGKGNTVEQGGVFFPALPEARPLGRVNAGKVTSVPCCPSPENVASYFVENFKFFADAEQQGFTSVNLAASAQDLNAFRTFKSFLVQHFSITNSFYKNKIDNKFEILLSKINSSNLNTFKSIFNSINDSKNDKKVYTKNVPGCCKAKIMDVKYINFLFFLKINSLFLRRETKKPGQRSSPTGCFAGNFPATQTENKNLINIKPLNLEICYKTLTIIYLYQTQKLVFPCSLDVELLIRYYG